MQNSMKQKRYSFEFFRDCSFLRLRCRLRALEAAAQRGSCPCGHKVRLVLDESGDGLEGHRLDQLLRIFLQAPGVELSTT